METNETVITAADKLLKPYAVKNSSGLGRTHDDADNDIRGRFQRDRGRIVHTREFRRLKGKTQVFVGGGGDHYRTRLTHTFEVSGISRDIARALQINEDLAECIALAHDIGHPPFGHAGETALDEWMQQYDDHFEHNRQSHRILTLLATHTIQYPGLNLNQEVLDGLLKHYTPHDHPTDLTITRSPSIEAQVVNISDEIAYVAHDTEDGLGAGILELDTLKELELISTALKAAEPRQTSLRGSIVNLLVMDLLQTTNATLTENNISSLDMVYQCDTPLVHFSVPTRHMINELREYLWNTMYNHSTVKEHADEGQRIIHTLAEEYAKKPNEHVLHLQKKHDLPLHIAIKDYIAGMTDAYAYLQLSSL